MLVIPAQSLLNPLTLRASPLNTIPLELFPSASSTSSPPPRSPGGGCRRLNTTQLLTLHLALTKDPLGRHKSEWQIFIASLPTFRPFHPLTWVVPNSDGPNDPWWAELESCLSESVRIKIDAVKVRYEADLAVLRPVLVSSALMSISDVRSLQKRRSSSRTSTTPSRTRPCSGRGSTVSCKLFPN
jgi:hypothetical protein